MTGIFGQEKIQIERSKDYTAMTPHKQPQTKNRHYAKYVKKALLNITVVVSVVVLSYVISVLLFGIIIEKFSKFALGVAITILIGMVASELFQGGTKR